MCNIQDSCRRESPMRSQAVWRCYFSLVERNRWSFFFFVKDLDVRVLRREIRLCIFLSFISYLQGLNYPFNYSFCKGKSEEKISLKCISPLKVKMQTRRYRALWQTSAEGSALAYFAKTFPREPPGRLDAAPGAPTLVIPGGPRT